MSYKKMECPQCGNPGQATAMGKKCVDQTKQEAYDKADGELFYIQEQIDCGLVDREDVEDEIAELRQQKREAGKSGESVTHFICDFCGYKDCEGRVTPGFGGFVTNPPDAVWYQLREEDVTPEGIDKLIAMLSEKQDPNDIDFDLVSITIWDTEAKALKQVYPR